MKGLLFPREEIIDFLNACEYVDLNFDEFTRTDIDRLNLALFGCIAAKNQLAEYYGEFWKSWSCKE